MQDTFNNLNITRGYLELGAESLRAPSGGALFPDFSPVSRSPPGLAALTQGPVWSDAASPPTRRGAPRSPSGGVTDTKRGS